MVIGIFVDFSVLGIILSILFYFTNGKKAVNLDDSSYTSFVRSFFNGLSLIFCGLLGVTFNSPNQELAWSEISRLAHHFLRDIPNTFTVSDIFTALVLLRFEQQAFDNKRVKQSIPTSSATKRIRFKYQSFTSASPAIINDGDTFKALNEFQEFAPYMIGIYGWKLQLYMNPLTFLMTLPHNLLRKCVTGTYIDHSIFKKAIGGEGKLRKILYSSFTSYLGEAIPYTITVDHESQAVVISLRGTASIPDIALDLLCEPVNLGLCGKLWGISDASKHYVHGGMLGVANRIRMDIERQQILHRLFKMKEEPIEKTKERESSEAFKITKNDRDSFLKAMGKKNTDSVPNDLMYQTEVFIKNQDLENMNCSNYRLIVCGHSLGSVRC